MQCKRLAASIVVDVGVKSRIVHIKHFQPAAVSTYCNAETIPKAETMCFALLFIHSRKISYIIPRIHVRIRIMYPITNYTKQIWINSCKLNIIWNNIIFRIFCFCTIFTFFTSGNDWRCWTLTSTIRIYLYPTIQALLKFEL